MKDCLSDDEVHSELKTMFSEGQFQKTVVLTKDPEKLMSLLGTYLNYCLLDGAVVCDAKKFYEHENNNRSCFLIVDKWENFKGLESSVFIMLNPFVDWHNPTASSDLNEFLIFFSRANCRCVVITKERKDERKFLEYILKKRIYNRFETKYFLPLNFKMAFYDSLRLSGKDIVYWSI